MGSVQTYMQCPHCSSEDCVEDYYYKTGEVTVLCQHCGYHRSFSYRRDNEGKLILKDPNGPFSFDNFIGDEIHIEHPYGSYNIQGEHMGQFGSLSDEAEYNEFKNAIKDLDLSKTRKIWISRFVDGIFEEEVLYQAENLENVELLKS